MARTPRELLRPALRELQPRTAADTRISENPLFRYRETAQCRLSSRVNLPLANVPPSVVPLNKVPTDGWKMTQEINYLHLLAGLVRCQPCGTEMTAIHNPHNQYVCITLILSSADDCATPPIDAEYLDRLVVTRMVKNMLTGKNLHAVIKGDYILDKPTESNLLPVPGGPRQGITFGQG